MANPVGLFDLPAPCLALRWARRGKKNLREFLDIDTPGSQVVVGNGPDLASLKREYPDVHFLGALSGEKLARDYAAADLFVFPSIADTFGLVVLEACAAGLRVAAMPVPGPSDIFADDTAKDFTAMDWDLGRAIETALQLRDNSDAPRASPTIHGRHVQKISTLICRRRLQRSSKA